MHLVVRILLLAAALTSPGCALWSRSAGPVWTSPPGDSAPMGLMNSGPAPTRAQGGTQPTTTNRPPAATPGPSGAGHGTGRPAPARQVQPRPSDAPQPFRPESTDELLRRPYRAVPETTTPPQGSGDSTGPTDPASGPRVPRMPDPNAGAPASGQLAAGGEWIPSATGSGPQGARHEQISTAAAITDDWKPLARSSGGRPIEYVRLGSGQRHVLVTASLVGNERESVACGEALVALLVQQPERLQGMTVLLVRTPNPDGYVEGTLTNGRGVALNLNFPSRNLPARRTSETGPAPASEPEVQALLALLDDFRPDRVVHLRSANYRRPLVLANAHAADSLRTRINRQIMDGGEFEAYKAGSLEEYTQEVLGTELLVVWLPASPGEGSGTVHIADVVFDRPHGEIAQSTPGAALEQREPERSLAVERPGPTKVDLFAPYEPPARRTGRVDAGVPTIRDLPPRGKKGFVEILPPPPEFADELAGVSPRFYELPPPPGGTSE